MTGFWVLRLARGHAGAAGAPGRGAERAQARGVVPSRERELVASVQIPPRLLASWAATAAGLTLMDAAALALEARRGARDAARHAAPGLALALALMHADTLIHLGRYTRGQDTAPLDTIGLPVALTLLRRTIAGFLWAHLMGGRPVESRRALVALLGVGAASDVVDGAVARRWGQVTRLGAYLDAEADFSFWASLVLTLGAQRLLPRWLIALLFVRFGTPVALAGVSHFGLHRPVQVGSTVAGKAAAVAQLVACAVALRPARKPSHVDGAVNALTAAVLLAAPIAQARRIFGWPAFSTVLRR